MGLAIMPDGVDGPDVYSGDHLGSGAESAGAPATKPSTETAAAQPAKFAGLGPLLEEEDPKSVVDAIVDEIRAQAPARKRRRAEWECNKLWLQGIRGARVRRLSEDRNDVALVVPLGSYDLPPVMDRVDELVDKTISRLYTDPPIPDAEPASDSDGDRDSAEFTTRLLTIEGAESGFNNVALQRRSQKKASVHGSGFIYFGIDPMGNGWRPTEIRALPTAVAEQDAAIDPESGAHLTDTDERLTTRYVMEDGKLTDDPSQARPQWLPKLAPEVLTGENVILLPETSSGINDACGVIILRYTTIGQLKAAFPETVGAAEDETLRKLVDWSPEDAKYVRPGFLNARDLGGGNTTPDGAVKDSALACTASLYYKSHGQYLKGAYIVAAGGDMVLHKQTWSGMVETEPGALSEECLELPVIQSRQLNGDVDDDHMGRGIVGKLGPADEVRGNIVLAWEEYLDQFLHRNVYLPLGSIIQPGEITRRDGTPILFNPQGKPELEDVPPFPADAKEFFDRATDAQNSAIGLEETAQGTESPNSQSGVAKQIVVQEAHVNLSMIRGNAADAQERTWRIVTQLYRVFYTIPQKLKIKGDDGAYIEREWSRADLGSTRDIRIARGSFTQMSHEQKQATLDARYAAKLIDPEEYDRLSAVNIQATVGYQDNPHRMRVRRQLSRFRDGPPKGWQPPPSPMMPDPMTGQPVPAVDPRTGQPMPPAPDPANPFVDVRPVDQEQDVARIHWLELRREQAGTNYGKQPAPWRKYLDDRYQQARQWAGIQTIPEKQAAMQQQAAAAQQAATSEQTAKHEADKAKHGATLAHNASEGSADRAFSAEQEQAKHRMALERDAMNAQGAGVTPGRAAPTLAPTGAFQQT